MKFLLAFFLLFCALTDPWVDGSGHLPDSAETEASMSVHDHGCHTPGGCTDSTEEHTCHFGHCGVFFSPVSLAALSDGASVLTDYSLYLPLAPTFGLKRPPKHS